MSAGKQRRNRREGEQLQKQGVKGMNLYIYKKEWIPPREEQNPSICYSVYGTGLHLSPLSESGSAFYPIKKFGN